MAARYALNKNKYLLDPEVERLERILEFDFEIPDRFTVSVGTHEFEFRLGDGFAHCAGLHQDR